MNQTQNAIAVALALAVVVIVFIYPGLSFFFGQPAAPQEQADATIESTTTQSVTTTMPTENTDKLQIIDETVGTGAVAAKGDVVTVNYVGSLTNGKVFDASANHGTSGFTFNLGAGQVIKGWDQGIVGMKVGGKRKLVIPAALAYGDQSVGGGLIPANSTLVFEVELLKVQKP